MKMRIWMTAASIIACIGISEASATTFTATWTGTVDYSRDMTGIFGITHTDSSNPNAYVGLPYTAMFVFEPSLGTDLGGAGVLSRAGGDINGSTSPMLSASVTVNGHTETLNPWYFGEATVNTNVGAVRYEADETLSTGGIVALLVASFQAAAGVSLPLAFGSYSYDASQGTGTSSFSYGNGTFIEDPFARFTVSENAVSAPLPAALPLVTAGLGLMGLLRRRRDREGRNGATIKSA